MIKNVSVTIQYLAWDTSANAGKTGDVANHAIRLVKDGTEAAAANTPTEISATNAPGWYKLVLTQAETNYNVVAVIGKSTTANISIFGPANIFTDQGSFAAIPVAVWANATRTLSSFGTLVADIWANGTRTLTALGSGLALEVWHVLESAIVTASTIGLKIKTNLDAAITTRSSHSAADVWSVTVRTLSSFGTLVADVATAVWSSVSRTLTAFGFTVPISGTVNLKNEVYVDEAGNDSNAGTINAPKKTFDAAYAISTTGGKIIVTGLVEFGTEPLGDYIGREIIGRGMSISANGGLVLRNATYKFSGCNVKNIRMAAYDGGSTPTVSLEGPSIFDNTHIYLAAGLVNFASVNSRSKIKNSFIIGNITDANNLAGIILENNVLHGAISLTGNSNLVEFIKNKIYGNVAIRVTTGLFTDNRVKGNVTFDAISVSTGLCANNLISGTLTATGMTEINNEQWAKAGATRTDLDADFTSTQKTNMGTAVWATSVRSLTTFGTLIADIWANGTRTLTALGSGLALEVWHVLESAIVTASTIGLKIKTNLDAAITSRSSHTAADVWSVSVRTLSSFGTLIADIWSYSTRTLTSIGSGLALEVWNVLESAITTVNSIGVKVKTNIDAAISTRSSHSAADVWTSATRTLTSFGTLVADTATAVWGAATRTLTSFGTIIADLLNTDYTSYTTANTVGRALNDLIGINNLAIQFDFLTYSKSVVLYYADDYPLTGNPVYWRYVYTEADGRPSNTAEIAKCDQAKKWSEGVPAPKVPL